MIIDVHRPARDGEHCRGGKGLERLSSTGDSKDVLK